MQDRIYLSPPHMSGTEIKFINQAFEDNWIAPVGPQLTEFETQFCHYTGAKYALALTSGTAALHLALLVSGIKANDEVFVSTLTFAASVNPIIYVGATPVFIDSDTQSWNIDPNILEDTLRKRAKINRLPKAIIPIHLYGQPADMDAIIALCNAYNIIVIEDAAEALGSRYKGVHPGTIGKLGVFSFNGNKIITTSGGGMLVSDDKNLIDHARKLSSQAREPVAHYEHEEIGYNYRMSNILAAIGCGQLQVIDERVQRKREIYDFYRKHLGDIEGLSFVDEMPYAHHSRWLTVALIDTEKFGMSNEQLRLKLEEHNIETRLLWKPMHQQPIFRNYDVIGGDIAENLFAQGLCLPSGTSLTQEQLERIVEIIQQLKIRA